MLDREDALKGGKDGDRVNQVDRERCDATPLIESVGLVYFDGMAWCFISDYRCPLRPRGRAELAGPQ